MKLRQRVCTPMTQPEVWQALNDPDVLKRCLPGCETFDRVAEDAFDFALTAKVGPLKAKFKGNVALTEVHAPHCPILRQRPGRNHGRRTLRIPLRSNGGGAPAGLFGSSPARRVAAG